eukprot:1157746-Pelagomonas_calceolata.AAC.2
MPLTQHKGFYCRPRPFCCSVGALNGGGGLKVGQSPTHWHSRLRPTHAHTHTRSFQTSDTTPTLRTTFLRVCSLPVPASNTYNEPSAIVAATYAPSGSHATLRT